ncbi:MAG: hypothetical protein AAFV46_16300, partial [Cyanobacteria bacterium J06635_11]
NGDALATVSKNGTAKIHYVSTENLRVEACDRLTRNLTRREWNRYIGEDLPYEQTCPNLPMPTDEAAPK